MDSQTASSDAPEPNPLNIATILDNAIIDKIKGNEFSNTARDTFKHTVNYNLTKEGDNLVLVSSDVINHLLKTVPPWLSEVLKNDQSRRTVAKPTDDEDDLEPQAATADKTLEVEPVDTDDDVPEPHAAPTNKTQVDPVDIMDIVPPDPSSLPVVSIADRYTRSMLKCLAGYPLYEPHPFSELSTEYLRNGVNIGDVGFVRGKGVFDFLFNICPSKNASINPPNLPDGFSLETSDHSAIRTVLRKTCHYQEPVIKTNSGEYVCEGSEGAVLELPEGAIEDEVTNRRPFEKLAARHGVQWYEYTMTRGRDISNGALYLITSVTKCAQWGIAVFDRKCASGQGLRFDKKRSLPFAKSTSKYRWKGSDAFTAKVSESSQGDAPNQAVFLGGYKIMLRQDIFDNLCNDQPPVSNPVTPPLSIPTASTTVTRRRAARIRGGGGPEFTSKTPAGGGTWSPTTMPTMAKSDEVVLHPNFNSSLVHPSDLINDALLSQNPNAKVALTHDDVWCHLLRNNFPELNYPRLINVARLYTNIVDEYDCVSLQKISNSSNVLDENSRPLQGTKTPALQRPRTRPDGNYTPVPCIISQTLPRELVERILFLLDTESMLICRLVNKWFNDIIQSSTVLQYFLACKAAGVIDNFRSPLTYSERFEALKKREDAWRKLKPVFETTIKVDHQPSPAMIYGLAGGAYFLDNRNLTDLNYCCLPSSPQDNPRWIKIPAHPGEGWSGIFINFALSEYEHDLMVNVISSDTGNQVDTHRHSIDLVLLKFSTGEYHPLARHPQVHVQRSPSARPSIIPRIVGDNLALVIPGEDGTFPDKLLIFDWKTGHKRLEHETIQKTYSDLVFVSPELLLVPNLILSNFEVWHLPPSHPNPKPPVQILSLRMPTISSKYSLFEVSCNGMPNPFLHSIPYFPPRPFFTSPEDSIIIINLVISLDWTIPPSSAYSFTLIMHRRALLDTIQKWTSFLEQGKLPKCLMNEVIWHKTADPDDGSVLLGSQSKSGGIPHSQFDLLAMALASSSRTSHISGESANSGFEVSSGSYDILEVKWSDWGPPISRWLQVSEMQGQLIATSAGQRYAFAVSSPRDSSKLMISVVDFNPYQFRRNVERMAQLREGEDGDSSGIGNNTEELETLDDEGVFSEVVYMGLKCVIYDAPDEYEFDQLLMDEERLLGFKLDDEGRDESIKVLYFG